MLTILCLLFVLLTSNDYWSRNYLPLRSTWVHPLFLFCSCSIFSFLYLGHCLIICLLFYHSIVCPLIYDFDLVGLFLLGKVFYRDYQDKWGLKTLNQKIKTWFSSIYCCKLSQWSNQRNILRTRRFEQIKTVENTFGKKSWHDRRLADFVARLVG